MQLSKSVCKRAVCAGQTCVPALPPAPVHVASSSYHGMQHQLCSATPLPARHRQWEGRRDTRARFTEPRTTPIGIDPQGFVQAEEATVEEIMQPNPILLRQDMTCHDAARVFLDHDMTCGPVVDASGKLVGVLSEGDLLWKSAGPLDHTIIPPVFVGAFDLLISLRDDQAVKMELDKILAHTVGQAMSKTLTVTTPQATLSAAAKTMLQAKVHMLPVVDNDGRVVGVVSQHDVLRGMVSEQTPLL